MKEMFILRGVPGSGKSHLASLLLASTHEDDWCQLCSADFYFTKDGVYSFDPLQLGEAHGSCFRHAVLGAIDGAERIVIDNTNISVAEIAPYVLLGQAYGYTVKIITVIPRSIELAAQRNTHGVPLEVIQKMAAAMENVEMPPWWVHETHISE